MTNKPYHIGVATAFIQLMWSTSLLEDGRSKTEAAYDICYKLTCKSRADTTDVPMLRLQCNSYAHMQTCCLGFVHHLPLISQLLNTAIAKKQEGDLERELLGDMVNRVHKENWHKQVLILFVHPIDHVPKELPLQVAFLLLGNGCARLMRHNSAPCKLRPLDG